MEYQDRKCLDPLDPGAPISPTRLNCRLSGKKEMGSYLT